MTPFNYIDVSSKITIYSRNIIGTLPLISMINSILKMSVKNKKYDIMTYFYLFF